MEPASGAPNRAFLEGAELRALNALFRDVLTRSRAALACTQVGSIAAGYFVWDLQECLRKFKAYGVPFLLHALLCLGAYAMTGWLNTYSWLGSFGLLYEASTPFMHLRMTLVALKRADGLLFTLCNVCFGLTYLIVRIGGGAYFAWTGLNLVYAEQCVALPYQIFATVIILGTCCLNCFWCERALLSAPAPRSHPRPRPRPRPHLHPRPHPRPHRALSLSCRERHATSVTLSSPVPLTRFSLIIKAVMKPRKPEGADTKPKAS